MSEEEKKAIKELKSCIFFWQGQLISSDNEEDEKIAKKEININKTLLNLIEKQQKEIENSVSKDKIRERIEELRMSGGSDGRDNTENLVRELVSEILEDLLEE